MPIHDWTRVDAGIFHDFHHEWISTIKRSLNGGLLPKQYYALAEQIAGGLGPDVLTLQRPSETWAHLQADTDPYTQKANRVVIRHASEHDVVAMVEIISPGNKNSRHGLQSFVNKAVEVLQSGIHLLILDLFAPGPRDPQGIVKAIWDELEEKEFTLPPDKRLTVSAYIGGPQPEVFVEPMAVGDGVPEMPLFLTPHTYVQVPLDAAYQSAWEAVPQYWRDVLNSSRNRG